MNELIERLRDGCVLRPKRWSGDTHDDLGGSIDEAATDALLREAAAALEAARDGAHPDDAAVDGAMPALVELVTTLDATGTVTGGRIYFPERQTRELLKKARDALAAHTTAAGAVPDGWRAVMESLVQHIERETCLHEETYRGGAIWEICHRCGQKWADDEGGRPEFKYPKCVEDAHAMLDAAQQEKQP